nr:hypothetical protein CFP56_35074 [Quercus suber]
MRPAANLGEAGASKHARGEGTAARSEMRPATNLGEVGASEHVGGGDKVDAITSGSNHGGEAGGREESGGRFRGDGGGGGVGEG